MNSQEFRQVFHSEKLIAIIRGVPAQLLRPVVAALLKGGVKFIEITANTADYVEMISEMKKHFGEKILPGAGTILTVDMASEAIRAGAEYIVAPDFNPAILEHCLRNKIAFVPGAMTPTEILAAHQMGASMIKLFPAATCGPAYVKHLRGPIGSSVGLIAVGGINLENITDFMRAGCQGVGLGSALIRKSILKHQQWDQLTFLAEQCKRELR